MISNFVVSKGFQSGNNLVKVRDSGDSMIAVTYHNNCVVCWDYKYNIITVDNCGYPTISTYKVIESALSQIMGVPVQFARRNHKFYMYVERNWEHGGKVYDHMRFEIVNGLWDLVFHTDGEPIPLSGWTGKAL